MKKSQSPLVFSYILLFSNTLLFLLKLAAYFVSNSIAILSDAINSLTDIIASIVVHFSIKMGIKGPDKDHPFGHDRAEPLAALFVAIIAAFLSFDIIKSAFMRLYVQEDITLTPFSIGVIIFTIFLKSGMYFILKKASVQHRSPSLEAGSVDARNDVFVSSIVLIGITATYFHYHMLDSIAAIILGCWILKTAYFLGRKNIDLLIGKSADKEIIATLRGDVLRTKGVKRVKQLHTHYVGSKIHVEVTVLVPKDGTVEESHALVHRIEKKIKSHPEVADAFVHVEPIDTSRK